MATAKTKAADKESRAGASKPATKTTRVQTAKAPAKPRAKAAAVAAQSLAQAPGYVMLPLDRIEFDPDQPRQDFHTLDGKVAPEVQRSLEELAANMDAEGLQHPITVRETEPGSGRYIVVVGERRTRAAMLNKWAEIPGKIRNDLVGARLQLFQLAENIQREDLSESDTARQVAKIVASGVPKKDIAKSFNKEPAWVTRYLCFADDRNRELYVKPGYFGKAWILYRFLQLPEHIQARTIESLKDPARQSRELASEELKRLEAYAKAEKEQAAEAAARSAAAAAAAKFPSSSPGTASEPSGGPATAGRSAAMQKLLGEDDDNDDGYRPPTTLVGGGGQASASTSARSGQLSYAGDNPDHDFSGTGRLATSMSELPAAATSVVAARLSIAQLAAVFLRLSDEQSETLGRLSTLATEFRIEAQTLRAVLEALGVAVEDIPDTVLPLRLAEIGQRLVKETAEA